MALDALRNALDTAVRGLQWVVNAYALVFAASLLLAGTLSDRLGTRRLYLIGLVLFTVASLGCGLASTLGGLVGWRVIQGFGAALLVPTSLALLRQLYSDPVQRRRAVGWWSAGCGIALAAGPVLGVMGVALLGGSASLPDMHLALVACVAALLLAMAIAFSGLKPSARSDAPSCLE